MGIVALLFVSVDFFIRVGRLISKRANIGVEGKAEKSRTLSKNPVALGSENIYNCFKYSKGSLP